MTESIYSRNNIDPKKLSRDYLKNPLKRGSGNRSGEIPSKEDLYHLYIELNLTYNNLSILFNVSVDQIIRWNKRFDIKKGGCNNKKTLQTKLKKYGCKTFNNKRKASETCLKKYGRTNVGQFGSPEHKKAIKEKYGKENYRNTHKRKETCLEKYGRSNVGYFGSQEHKKAMLDKYGDENYNNPEQHKRTIFKRYGTDYYAQSEDYKQKKQMIVQKIHNTKKKNNSFTKSKPEEDYYQKLCEQFGKDNVIRQFKSKLYPFNCDFYIPMKDLYIEYNGNWTHGSEPYDPNKKEHQLRLNEWIEMDRINSRTLLGKKSYYSYAIKYWTISDPLKRETAYKNNLNFIEIW